MGGGGSGANGGGGWPSDAGVPLSHVDYTRPGGDMGAVGINGGMSRDDGRRGDVDSSGDGAGGLDMGIMRPFDPMHGMGDGRESLQGPFHGMGTTAEVNASGGGGGGGPPGGGGVMTSSSGGRPLSPLLNSALGDSSGSSPPGLVRLGSGMDGGGSGGGEAPNGFSSALQHTASPPSPPSHKPGRKTPCFDPISGAGDDGSGGGVGRPGSAAGQHSVDSRGSGSIDGRQSKEGGGGSGGGGVAAVASGGGGGGGGSEVSKTSTKPQENGGGGGGGGGLVRGDGGGGKNNDAGDGDEARKRLRIEELLH